MAGSFETFAALHVPGNPVVLYNIWDVGSALAVVKAGAKALATGSHPVADANGWPDGQQVPMDFAFANARRIAEAVDVPLTVDFEGAYSAEPEEGGENVRRLADTGAVGCNFEDQEIGGPGLHPIKEQAARVAAVAGSGLWVNARTDVFLRPLMAGGNGNDRSLLPEALERAHAYAEAGGNSLFVPGVSDPDLIAEVCAASPEASLFGSNYKDVYAFIVLILVLVFRPQGLLGERVGDRA